MNVSVRTVQRLIKSAKTIRSYDHNGRYFSLLKLAKFDTHGIWEYNNIHFSKFGNLKQTLIAIVSNSAMGMDASQIREVIGMETRSFLSQYSDVSQLRREHIGGRFVYFSAVRERFMEQSSKREKTFIEHQGSGLQNSVAISILVAAIQHPDFSIEELSQHLCKEKVYVEALTIKLFFAFHGIGKKTDLAS